jgi:hypothetical protein
MLELAILIKSTLKFFWGDDFFKGAVLDKIEDVVSG